MIWLSDAGWFDNRVLRSEDETADRSAALARWEISLWDSLILAAARASGTSELITEDLSHGQHYGGVRAVNPFL